MAISDSQKIDYLWKKLGYGKAKTDLNSAKNANNESIPSPILMRGGKVWAQSDEIPESLPASSTNLVTVYPTTNPLECTADTTSALYRTWNTNAVDWVPPEFGATYFVKVYVHTSGDAANAASSGTQLFASGSENNDEWFFDYQAGTLHFMGDNLPNGVNFSGKSIYISGGRYAGIQGVTELNGIGIATGPHDLNVPGTIVGSAVTLFDFRGVGVATVYYDSGIGTVFFEGAGESTVGIGTLPPQTPDGGDLWYNVVDGRTYVYYDEAIAGVGTAKFWIDAAPFNVGEIDIIHINADTLTVSGVSTVGNLYAGGSISVNGTSSLNGGLEVSGVTTFSDVVGLVTATFADNAKILLGDNTDLQIYHDGTRSIINNPRLNDLRIQTSENILAITHNGGVEIYNNSNSRFISSDSGNTLRGQTELSNVNISGITTSSSTVNLNNLNATGISTITNLSVAQLNVSGFLNINEVTEVVGNLTGSGGGGDVTHDLETSALWYHTSIAGNFTVDVTNVPTTNNRAIAMTLILDQGANGYVASGFKIDGVSQVIKWQGGVQPTPSTFNIDTITFTMLRVNNAWQVLGQLTIFD